MGGRGASSGKKSSKTPDVKFSRDDIAEYEKTFNPDRTLKDIQLKVHNEPFKAILNSTEGTKITVQYYGLGFSDTGHYEIGKHGSNKVLRRINEDGQRLHKGYVIRSVHDVKKHINPRSAAEITIHGRDLRAEARERSRQAKELFRNLQKNYESYQAKQRKK